MTFASITFQKIVFKPFKQSIGCLLKGCEKIIHVIRNHELGIFIRVTGNIDVITTKNKLVKSSGPSIEPCGKPNIIPNQVL